MKLLIVGAGGYGQLVKEIAEMTEMYEQIDFLDDNYKDAIGKLSDLINIQDDYDCSVIAIGNPILREKTFLQLKKPITILHPGALISKSAVIGRGCVIEANAVISANAIIKDGTFVCAGAVVNHNAIVSEFCQVDCNAVVSAGAILPKGAKLNECSVCKTSEVAKTYEDADMFL